jgi:hypothetical protein
VADGVYPRGICKTIDRKELLDEAFVSGRKERASTTEGTKFTEVGTRLRASSCRAKDALGGWLRDGTDYHGSR